jgi:hypothetical protein
MFWQVSEHSQRLLSSRRGSAIFAWASNQPKPRAWRLQTAQIT